MEVKVPMAKVEDYDNCGKLAEQKIEALKKDLGIA